MQDCHNQTAGHCSHRVLVGFETSDAKEAEISTNVNIHECMSCCSKECKYTNWYVCMFVHSYVCMHACMESYLCIFMHICTVIMYVCDTAFVV